MNVNRFMLLALSEATLLGALIVPAWSDNLPAIPSPKGFIESSSLVPALKEQALLGHPARTRLIGVYLLPDELAPILHGGPQQMTIFCRAYVNDEFRSQDEAKTFFRQMIANAKKEDSRKFDLSDPDVSRIVKRYVDATKERYGQSVNMNGATFLGSILETEDIYATSLVVSLSAQMDQAQVLIPLTGAVAWIRQGNQILELSDMAQFDGSQSIETANGVLMEWLKALAAPAVAGPFEDGVAAYARRDYATALSLILPLAQQGLAKAQFNLGVMYEQGRGVPPSAAEAMKWYRLAADQGLAEAQHNVGVMYDEGRGVPRNDAEAAKWYRLAADRGLASARYNLGVRYGEGRGVPQNDAEAMKWLRLAADQGLAVAQYNLGVKYDEGRGVPPNPAEAVKWYRLAADQGLADAQNNLGVIFAEGRAVPQDYVAAHMWLNLAAARGYRDAVKNRALIEQRMTSGQIVEAQKLAREWKPTK